MFGFGLNKCEYKAKCAGYKENSETCTKALDKRYCGTYRQFLGSDSQ